MKTTVTVTAVALVLALAGTGPATAQGTASQPAREATDPATREDVQREADEAVKAVESHGAVRRETAQARAREAVESMQARMVRLQDEWTRERMRLDDQARERRTRMFAGARERLELAQQRSGELDAASEVEWMRARTRFIESYRVLARDVQGLVERSMPGRPVPPDGHPTEKDEHPEADEILPQDESPE